MSLIEQSIKDYEALGVPTVEAQELAFEKYRSAGKLTPEMEEAIKLGDSNMMGVSLDPTYKTAQIEALNKLKEIGSNGGMTLSDQASYEKMQGNLGAEERGRREAILADTRSKGQMGSGLELAAQLMNQQDSARRAHEGGLNIQAEAQKRALDAIMQSGELGGKIRGQEFGEKSKVAEAQDMIAKWNAENSQAVRGRNTGLRNSAQEFNLKNDQRVLDSNVDLSNQQQQHNKALAQQQFQNQMSLQAGKANSRSNQATNLNNAANATQAAWTKAGQGVAQAGSAYAQGQRDDQRWKEEQDLEKYKADRGYHE